MSRLWYHVDSDGRWMTRQIVKHSDTSVWYEPTPPDGTLKREGIYSFGGRWTPNYEEALNFVKERVADARKRLEKREESLRRLMAHEPPTI